MIRAIVIKELRENAWIAALALALYLAFVYQLMPHEKSAFNSMSYTRFRSQPESVPFVDGSFASYFLLISYAAAIGLGLRQSTRESNHGTYLFLLHRPWSREKIFLTKLSIGAALLLVCAAVPILEYSCWAATPGDVAAPFEWSMTLGSWRVWATTPLVYLAAFPSGLRPARWYGTRLLSIVGLFFCFLLIELLEQNFGAWIGVVIAGLLYCIYLWLILDVAQTRDYS